MIFSTWFAGLYGRRLPFKEPQQRVEAYERPGVQDGDAVSVDALPVRDPAPVREGDRSAMAAARRHG